MAIPAAAEKQGAPKVIALADAWMRYKQVKGEPVLATASLDKDHYAFHDSPEVYALTTTVG